MSEGSMTDTAPTPGPRNLIKRLREAAARKWPGAEPAERHSLFSQAADAIEAMTAPTPDRAAMMQALEALCLDAGGEEQIRIEADAIAALRAALAHPTPAIPQSKRERDACAPGAEFEHWWPKYMPRALQDDAWAEWCAIRSNSAPPAEPADPLAWVTSSAAPPQPPSAPAEPAKPVAACQVASQWGRLYTTANALVAQIGAHGDIASDDDRVASLMDALHDLDGGEWMPGLMPAAAQPPQPLSKTAADYRALIREDFERRMKAEGHSPTALTRMDSGAYLSPVVADAWTEEKRRLAAQPPQPVSGFNLSQIVRQWQATPGALIHPDLEKKYAQPPATEQPVQAPAGWVPVTERLPDSGKVVLACYTNRAGRVRRIRAEWVAEKSREANSEDSDIGVYDEATDTFYDPPGWYEKIDNWGDYSSVAVCEGEVTHWMDMPAAPAPAPAPAKEQP
jgi:hypothetical protein